MSESEEIKITGFMSVFEQKLDKLIGKIKKEYEKPKKERDKESLKSLAQEAKHLRKLVRKCKEKEGIAICCCPKCGHEFET